MAAAALGELTGLTRLKIGYNKITGLHFMSGRTEMGYEVG